MADLESLFAGLRRSRFRSRFRLNDDERTYLARKGLDVILEHGARFIEERLSSARPRNDGRQTPFRGHPVFVAQHATATCCRSCLAKWHGIPQGLQLSPEQREYILLVIRCWLEGQSPGAA
jgi:hypothetical protein